MLERERNNNRRSATEQSVSTDDAGTHLNLQATDLKNTRDLRTLLLDAVYELQAQRGLTDARVTLLNCKLAYHRVKTEVEWFKKSVHPALAKKLSVRDNRVRRTLDLSELEAVSEEAPAERIPKVASKEAVMAYLLNRYVEQAPPVTIARIALETGASLPTIYSVIRQNEHSIVKNPEDKTLSLANPIKMDWLLWMDKTNRLASVSFVDRSGAPRSAERLAKKLRTLGRDDLAIGGLMGALHHLRALDATAAPQLDILMHGTPRSDLSFIDKLDPGLKLHKGRGDQANVVVHFIDRPKSLFASNGGYNWGTLPDCLANMQKAGLTHQVQDALTIIQKGKP